MPRTSRRTIAKIVAGRLVSGKSDSSLLMKELAAYLIENGMADEADIIINDIADELYQQSNRLVVEVTSAHPLDDASRRHLTNFLRQQTGARAIDLYETVDKNLIGGLVAKTPSAELDVSIRTTLRQLTALA